MVIEYIRTGDDQGMKDANISKEILTVAGKIHELSRIVEGGVQKSASEDPDEGQKQLQQALEEITKLSNRQAQTKELSNLAADNSSISKIVDALAVLPRVGSEMAGSSKEAADQLKIAAKDLSDAGTILKNLEGGEGNNFANLITDNFSEQIKSLEKMAQDVAKSSSSIDSAAGRMLEKDPGLGNAVNSLVEFLKAQQSRSASPAAKASGFIPNFAPNIGVNINAVTDAYKREVTSLVQTGVPMSAAKGLVSMDTNQALKTERNPEGVGLYSEAFGEKSLPDAIQKTRSSGFNPVKYAGGGGIPNFAPQIFSTPSQATGKHTLRHGGLTYQFSSEKEKIDWIKQQQSFGSPPPSRKAMRPIDRSSPAFYDSSVTVPGEPGYHPSNKPKELLPLDRASTITVGNKGGGRLDNRFIDETKVRYDDIVSGRFSTTEKDDGTLRTQVITKDKFGRQQVKSFRQITNEEAQTNSSLYGLAITNRRMEHLHTEHPGIYQDLITSAKEYHSAKKNIMDKSLAGNPLTSEEIKKRSASEKKFKEARAVAHGKLREDFDLKTHRRPSAGEKGVKRRAVPVDPLVDRIRNLHKENPKGKGKIAMNIRVGFKIYMMAKSLPELIGWSRCRLKILSPSH